MPPRRPGAAPAPTGEFVALLSERARGRLKVYVGSAAGTGKTYRMLQEAHELRRRGMDCVVGFVETHGRAETAAQLGDLEVVPRRRMAYRGIEVEEMDLDALLERRPAVAIVDELAHTNVPGSRHQKRWEDVLSLLEQGISVITAVNVQHLESLGDVLQRSLGVTIRETIPDWLLAVADQVVNLDIPAEDLRQRLLDGKIYPPDKVQAALNNFFVEENLATLRELALREVASAVDRQREEIAARETGPAPAEPRTVDRLLVGISGDAAASRALLRQATRIAGRLNSDWYCVWVRTPHDRADRIAADKQRHVVDSMQRAQALGAEVVTVDGSDVAAALLAFAAGRGCSMILIGPTRRTWLSRLTRSAVADRLLAHAHDVDILVVRSAVEGAT
jgi:two-component system sensor histidine kinase KdpD